MVRSPGRWHSTRGKSRLGCLLIILLLAAGAYYGFGLGSVYVKYWRLKDEMRTQARLAPSIDDVTIQRRLLRKIEELDLPDEARNVTIRRTTRPREIRISTTYHVVLELPFFTYVLALTPDARQPL